MATILNFSTAGTGNSDLETARTQGEKAYLSLYQAIVAGHFAPNQPLRPEDLKNSFGFGGSPLREALLRLAAEGLVQLQGHRGFQMPPATVEELLDIARVRCELSLMALRWSIERGDDAWEALVVGAFHRLEKVERLMKQDPVAHAAEHEARNREFHRALESACGSPLLLEFGHKAFSRSERYRRHFVDYTQLLPNANTEHRDMMEAALERRADEACAQLRDHIMNNAQIVRQCLEHRQQQAAAVPNPSPRRQT